MNKKIHDYFKKLNMEDRIIEFDKSSASVMKLQKIYIANLV